MNEYLLWLLPVKHSKHAHRRLPRTEFELVPSAISITITIKQRKKVIKSLQRQKGTY